MTSIKSRPLIVAHRGASAVAPENTFAAFRRAIEDGAEGIELDVRLTRDGRAVVFHDPTLNRTGLRGDAIATLTAAELSRIDVGSWFNISAPAAARPEYSRETVATLAATLDFLKDFTGRIYVELKCDNGDAGGLVLAVCSACRNTSLIGQIVVKSFRLEVLPQIHLNCSELKTAALFAPKMKTILRKEKHLVKLAEEFGADELSVHYTLATRKLMEKAAEHGLPVTVWTADNPRLLGRWIRLGLKAIVTNNPARLLAKRDAILKN